MSVADVVRKLLDSRLDYIDDKGSECNFVCPFCLKDTGEQHTLHVNFYKGDFGMARCHTCNYGARDARNVVRDVFGYMPENLERMLRKSPLVFNVEKILGLTKDAAKDGVESLPKGFRKLPMKPKDLSTAFLIAFLKARGFGFADIDAFNIGYVPFPEEDQEAIRGYIIFPFYANGKLIYWQGRRVTSPNPNKSYNPPSTKRKSILFGYQQAVGMKRGFLCEGPLDAIAWGKGGLGLMAKYLHPPQIKALALLGLEELIVCLDDTEHALTKHMALTLSNRLSYRVGYLLLKDGDPAEHKSDIHSLADRKTRWLDRKLEHRVSDMLSHSQPRRKLRPIVSDNFSERIAHILTPD